VWTFAPIQYTFSANLISFGSNIYNFSNGFLGFLFSIDLLHPFHLGFLFLLIIMGMGIRPSFIGEKNQEKVNMLYDLKNIRYNILHKPLYIILWFLASYIFFYISILLNNNLYISIFSILGWLSIISIISLIITHLVILLIYFTDKINGLKKYIPIISIPVSYIFIRIVFFYLPIPYLYSISLLFTIIITTLMIILLSKNKTNKFKTKIDMDSLLKLGKGQRDDQKRIIRK